MEIVGSDAMDYSTLREVTILQQVRGHQSFVQLQKVMRPRRGSIVLELELMDGSLHDLLVQLQENESVLPEIDQFFVIRRILEGLDFMRQKRIVHRDLKPGNILFKFNSDPTVHRIISTVKIADFGLSRQLSFYKMPLSPKIASLPYRPPEILMGD